MKSWLQERISGCFSVNLTMILVISLITVLSLSIIGIHRFSESIFVLVFKYSGSDVPICSAVAPRSYDKKKKYFSQQVRNTPGQLIRHNQVLWAIFIFIYPYKYCFKFRGKKWNYIVIRSYFTGTVIHIFSDLLAMCLY